MMGQLGRKTTGAGPCPSERSQVRGIHHDLGYRVYIDKALENG